MSHWAGHSVSNARPDWCTAIDQIQSDPREGQFIVTHSHPATLAITSHNDAHSRAPSPVDTIGESETFTDRPTRNGSRMFYELKVLQQPEPAADRRPVDPPPVVQLHVYEGPTREEARDVTFNYRANFFLYAELCPARPMAHGRVNTPAATSAPVLTGMPVSGMAYLDRPTEAGYFLFPDLSVRHEGRYVLAFHLYEDIKQEEDRDPEGDAADEALNPAFMYRLAVKSVPFNVFSAKKFPGLTESTNLSKTISEQGCRVRIRRDVRMRRRDGKPAGNDFENNPENEYRNSRRTQTPEIRSNAEQFRARSSSNSSEHRAAYPPAPERRPSAVESFQAPPPPPPPPMAYGPAPSTNVHLRFGSDASSAPYPPHQYAQPSAQPPPISPTTASYQSNQPSPYHPTSSYGYSSRPSSQYATSNPPPTPRDAYDRRPSAMAVPPSPSVYGTAPGPKDIDMPPETARAGAKRVYGETFAEDTRPLFDRQRQQDAHHSAPYGHRYDPMEYKRADGSCKLRQNNSFMP
ncbi:sexual development activator [Colletotrichum tofieldiae]|nr:sexual development activator [Colletotrichum tofieldiae]